MSWSRERNANQLALLEAPAIVDPAIVDPAIVDPTLVDPAVPEGTKLGFVG